MSDLGKGVVAWDVDGERVTYPVDASLLTPEELQDGIDFRSKKNGGPPILIDIPGFEHNRERTIEVSQRIPGVGTIDLTDKPIKMKERDFLKKSDIAYGVLGGITGGGLPGLASIPAVALGVPGMQRVAKQAQREAGATPQTTTLADEAKVGALEGGVQAATMGAAGLLKTGLGRLAMATGQASIGEALGIRNLYRAIGMTEPLPSTVAKSKPIIGMQTVAKESVYGSNRMDLWAAKAEREILEFASREFAGPGEGGAGDIIKGSAGRLFAKFRRESTRLYNRVDAMISSRGGDSFVIPLKDLDVADAFTDAADLIKSMGGARERRILQTLRKASKSGLAISYEQARQARSMLGRLSSSPAVARDPRGRALREIRDVLTDRIESRVRDTLGKDVVSAMRQADDYYRVGINRTDDFWKVIDKKTTGADVMGLMRRWVKGADVERLDEIMGSLKPDEARAIQTIFMRRHIIGESETGFKGFKSVIDNYENLTPQTKDALFGTDTKIRESLENFYKAAKHSLRFGGDIQDVAPGVSKGMLLMDIMTPTTAGAGGLAWGGPGAAILMAGLYPIGVNRTAHLLTNPAFLDWMTTFAKLKPNGVGPQLGRLVTIYQMEEDPEVKEALINFIGNVRQRLQEERPNRVMGLLGSRS